jgi:hypothetical protein
MLIFPAADLQRRPAEVQKAAMREPVFLAYHDKPRFVFMSLEDFVKMTGLNESAAMGAFPESVVDRIQEIIGVESNAGKRSP